MNVTYIKCISILLSNCYSSEIIDERNFAINEKDKVKDFFKKYSEDKYRCFQIVLENK